MNTPTIEEELTDLKERVRRLENAAPPRPEAPKWREAFGALKGEPLLREAARLGAEWREQENQRQ